MVGYGVLSLEGDWIRTKVGLDGVWHLYDEVLIEDGGGNGEQAI